MATLRDPEKGCAWDIDQTFDSIAPYTIEEAYEVADAIARGDMDDLRDELGDLLLQVVFHAQMAKDAGFFDYESVAAAICDKMIRRHPHVFSDRKFDSVAEQKAHWEQLKAEERREKSTSGNTSAMDGVAVTLPALVRAEKIQKRAARVGFDWPDTEGPAAKVSEEMIELHDADADTKVEEAGDLLFAAVNLVRAHGINAEDALRAANHKFERRFRAMEEQAGGKFPDLSLDEQEALWQDVKQAEKP